MNYNRIWRNQNIFGVTHDQWFNGTIHKLLWFRPKSRLKNPNFLSCCWWSRPKLVRDFGRNHRELLSKAIVYYDLGRKYSNFVIFDRKCRILTAFTRFTFYSIKAKVDSLNCVFGTAIIWISAFNNLEYHPILISINRE